MTNGVRKHGLSPEPGSVLEASVLIVATGTLTELGAGMRRVKLVATNAVKDGLAALQLETGVFATVIIKPQAEKHRRDQQAVDDGSGGEIEHGSDLTTKGTKGTKLFWVPVTCVRRAGPTLLAQSAR
jgi:hypothetical protein